MEKVNWPMVLLQGVSTALIVIIMFFTFISNANNALKEEVRAEISEMRTDLRAISTRLSDIDSRLGRVEGFLRFTTVDSAEPEEKK